jgi:hypothetical protein
MLILNVYSIVKWAKRTGWCTVRSTGTRGGPLKQIASPAITGPRHWKLRLVTPEIRRTASRYCKPPKQGRCKSAHHDRKKSEWSLEADARTIERFPTSPGEYRLLEERLQAGYATATETEKTALTPILSLRERRIPQPRDQVRVGLAAIVSKWRTNFYASMKSADLR